MEVPAFGYASCCNVAVRGGTTVLLQQVPVGTILQLSGWRCMGWHISAATVGAFGIYLWPGTMIFASAIGVGQLHQHRRVGNSRSSLPHQACQHAHLNQFAFPTLEIKRGMTIALHLRLYSSPCVWICHSW